MFFKLLCAAFERFDMASVTYPATLLSRLAMNSMSPLLSIGDVVAVEENVDFSDIRIGDIIVFKEPISYEGNAIISRVNEILTDPRDDLVILTKGDANSGSIPGINFPIYQTNFIGVVFWKRVNSNIKNSRQR